MMVENKGSMLQPFCQFVEEGWQTQWLQFFLFCYRTVNLRGGGGAIAAQFLDEEQM